jgi:hypothetical protein
MFAQVNDDIIRLADTVRGPIREVSGMEPDFSALSLAAVDHYLEQLPPRPPEELIDVGIGIGCYFGEVVRRALGGTWQAEKDAPPEQWMLVFDLVPLRISPVGMAVESIFKAEVDGYDGSLHVPGSLLPALEAALTAMGEVEEDYYYSLTGRLETVQHLIDVLAASQRPDIVH